MQAWLEKALEQSVQTDCPKTVGAEAATDANVSLGREKQKTKKFIRGVKAELHLAPHPAVLYVKHHSSDL